MTQDHRKTSTQIAQEALLDDAGFLKEVLERVLQELLEAEMTEHVGAAPYENVVRGARVIETATSRDP